MSKKEVIEDFLEVDDPIGGQNYVCVSFVDPEEIIQNKEAFKTAKFLQSYAKDKGMKFEEVYEDYENFQYKFQDEIQRDYNKENKNINNIRGVKIRGVFSSKEEAESKAKKLHRTDSTFHVFIGQVGYWLPFNPCADKIESEEFIDSGLNEMMQKYKENNASKDILYEEQKRDKIKAAQEEVKKAKEKELEEKNKLDNQDDPILEEVEPEAETETEVEVEPEAEVEAETEAETEAEPESESITEGDSKLDESLKNSLKDIDPWLKNKLSDETA